MSNYAIYKPKNKAAEYSEWACNFYVGCSNGCTYCYCKKGILAGAMGRDKPQLKKYLKDESHAIEVFENELKANLPELQKHGLFFSFTTDPMLPETIGLTLDALILCNLDYDIPVKILTKCTEWVDPFLNYAFGRFELISIGFTLTGHDELEPNAPTNAERIETMRKLHEAGFKTFASIEPIIDLSSSFQMISETSRFCDLYKIGLMSGVKVNRDKLQLFIMSVIDQSDIYGSKLYFKDSLLKSAEIERSELPSNCVSRDYNIFKP